MPAGLSAICIPIQSTGGPVGVLAVVLERNQQTVEEINLLAILAEITGNAIHRAQLYDQSQKQVRRLTSLRDIDSAIASSFDLRLDSEHIDGSNPQPSQRGRGQYRVIPLLTCKLLLIYPVSDLIFHPQQDHRQGLVKVSPVK